MTDETQANETPDADTEPGADRYIGNLLLPLIVLALVAISFVQALDFPQPREDVGPAGVPYLWMSFTAFFCIVLIAQAVMKILPPDPIPGRIGFVFLFAGWLAVYLLAIQNVGYYASTFVFLIASMYVLTYRNFAIMVAIAITWLVFAYFIFARLLYIPLPEGPLMKMLLG